MSEERSAQEMPREDSYPNGDHLRLVTWREIREWNTPYDMLAAEIEAIGEDDVTPGEPSFLYGAVEGKLRERLGDEHWELDSQGRAGIIVKADEGYRFSGELTLVDERTQEVIAGTDMGQESGEGK